MVREEDVEAGEEVEGGTRGVLATTGMLRRRLEEDEAVDLREPPPMGTLRRVPPWVQ